MSWSVTTLRASARGSAPRSAPTTSSTSRSVVSISSASSAGCMRTRSDSSRDAQVGRERVGADVGPLGLAARARESRDRPGGRPSPRRRARRRCRCRGPRSRRCPDAPSSRCRSRITSRTSWWRATTGTIRSIRDWRIAEVTSMPAMKTRPASSNVTGFCARERRRAARRRRAAGPRASRARSARGTSRPCRGSGSRAAPRACGRQCSCRRLPVRRWRQSSLGDLLQEVDRSRGRISPRVSAPSISTPFAARRALQPPRAWRSGGRRGRRPSRRCGRVGTPVTEKPSVVALDAAADRAQRVDDAPRSGRSPCGAARRRRRPSSRRGACDASSAKSGSSSTSSGTSLDVDRRRGQLGAAHLEVADLLGADAPALQDPDARRPSARARRAGRCGAG